MKWKFKVMGQTETEALGFAVVTRPQGKNLQETGICNSHVQLESQGASVFVREEPGELPAGRGDRKERCYI